MNLFWTCFVTLLLLFSFGFKGFKAQGSTDIERAHLVVYRMKKRPLATRQAAQGMRLYIAEVIANLVSRFCWHYLPLGFVYPYSYSNCESSHVAAADHPRRVRHRRQDRNIGAPRPLRRGTVRVDLTRLVRRMNM